MPQLNVKPQTVLLTSGQATTFEATNDAGQPVSVGWSLNPPIGNFASPAGNTKAPSATYVAPPVVAAAQTVAVIADGNNDSASATICLTPYAISIVPAKVDLKAGQEQKFVAIVAGASPGAGAPALVGPSLANPTWILSPPLGSVSQDGLYKAPSEIRDSTTVTITATSEASGKQATAAINLSSPPWTGTGVQLLGGFLLLVFALVFLMVLLWPPALPSPDTAKANRTEAEKTLEERTAALEKAETASVQANAKLNSIQEAKKKQSQPTGAPGGSKTDQNTATEQDAKPEADAADYVLQRAKEAREGAEKDLDKKRGVEEMVNDPSVETKLVGKVNRELDLLGLVLLAGCLGAFLHMAQSFSDYVGNRTIKSNWAWWYYFRPFIGAGLALVVYAAMRGGFMAIATGSNAKASELNPFGLVGVAALVGMFSRAATMKLGEVFDTLFKTDAAKESKDKLAHSSQTSSQSAGTTAASGATSAAAN